MRWLFGDIVSCGPCVADFLPIFSWTWSIHKSINELSSLKEEIASSMVWHSALTPRRCTPNILHNEWSSSRNLQREFLGVMSFMAPTVVSTTKMDLPSTHNAVGWEREAAKLEPSRDLSAPDPANTRISEFACEKRRTTRDVRSVKITLPSEDTSNPWTVWQNRVPFLTITWLSEVEGLNFVMPPLLLESATYNDVSVKGQSHRLCSFRKLHTQAYCSF